MVATRNMHKPGWRTRRRSRLSLVERAVPQLGRSPSSSDRDSGDKVSDVERADPSEQANGVDADRAADTKDDVARSESEVQAGAASEDDGAVDLSETADRPVAEEAAAADTEAMSATAFETVSESVRQMVSSSQPVEGTPPEAAADGTSEDVQEASPPDISEPPTASEADAQEADSEKAEVPAGDSISAPAEAASPSEVADTESPTSPEREPERDASSSDEQPIAAALPAARDAVGPIEAEHEDGVDGSFRTSYFEPDWHRLAAEGFVDPRSDHQHLPTAMKDIVRALIRQALSDQSSWRDRVILVTSPNERTAKTTASIDFALGLVTAEGHRVVLADADTGGPGAVERLGCHDGACNLCEALANEDVDVADLLIRTDIEQLNLVASGIPDDDTFDRFASRRMLQVLRYLTGDPGTLLIIDAPPILASQEAAVLSVVAGQVVLAVEAGRTTADSIEHALQRIGDRHNVSLVLTESAMRRAKEEPATKRRPADDAVSLSRRPPGSKPSVAKATVAAASVVFLAFLAFKPPTFAGPTLSEGQDGLSASAARWSIEPHMTVLRPDRMDR